MLLFCIHLAHAQLFFFVLEHSMTRVCPTSNLLSLTVFLNPES